ncbi:MAG: substrate-binding domain-containing protein [Thermoplasmata archaeon]|nr:substrate-binding domain-containing protein [Thermoplasmata archaeon]
MRKKVLRRRAYLQRKQRAVSPVVATLILILVAVAAAAALYLWLVAWQGNVTGGIGTPTAQYTVTIGGSSSVYPFDQVAVKYFEQNNSNVIISNNQGGSGAGMAAVCAGQVDIGASSAVQTPSTLESKYNCPITNVQETVAYDAVDMIVPTANTHTLNSISQTDVLAIYVSAGGGVAAWSGDSGYSQGVAFSSGTPYAYPVGIPAADAGVCGTVPIPTATCPIDVLPAPSGTGGVYSWNTIPACVPQQAGCTNATIPSPGVPEHFTGTAAGSSACEWTVCASSPTGSTSVANTIAVWHRLDPGGTEQSFTARILGIGAASATPALGTTSSASYLQFTGCTGTGQLNACTVSTSGYSAGDGNPGVITGVAAGANAIGFASDGLVLTAGSGVVAIPFAGPGQPTAVTPSVAKTIPQGILGNFLTTAGASNGYVGWRPFILVETNVPTGEVLRFLQFVMDPAVNQACALSASEVSPFQSGMAGVVPVTPLP